MMLNSGPRHAPPLAMYAARVSPAPERCEYTSKHCTNPRALKPNGKYHRLCDLHRLIANENQRRWQQRKRQLKSDDGKEHDELMRKSPKLTAVASDEHKGGRVSPLPELIHVHATPSLERPLAPILPRLHQHHILSRALLLPVTVKSEGPVEMDSSQLLWYSPDRRQHAARGLSLLRPSI